MIQPGMFQMLNQAIQQSPLVGPAGTGMLDMASMGLGGAAGAVTGTDPYGWMSPTAKIKQATQDLADVDMTTSAGMEEAAAIYGKSGQAQNQMTMAEAASKKRTEEVALLREQKLREALTKQARDMGLTDMATQIASGGTDLEKDQEKLQDLQIKDLLRQRGEPARMALAKRYGISNEEYKALGYDQMEIDELHDTLKGLKASAEPFADASGVTHIYRVDESGKVFDKNTQTWVPPSTLGLKPAPNVQKVIDASSVAGKKLGELVAGQLPEVLEKANQAQLALDNINRALPIIDKMPTGILADVQAFALKVAADLGIPVPTEGIENYEVFLADAAQRVVANIKNFGTGSAISDADREYAKLMSAASASARAESLKRLLHIQREAAQGTITYFNELKETTRDSLSAEDKHLVDNFIIRPAAAPPTPTGLSPDAQRLLEEARANQRGTP